MSGPRRLVAGNWKMNGAVGALREAHALAEALSREPARCRVAIFPPALLIHRMALATADAVVEIGAQDCHAEASGAYTGDLSAEMLREAGATLGDPGPFGTAHRLSGKRRRCGGQGGSGAPGRPRAGGMRRREPPGARHRPRAGGGRRPGGGVSARRPGRPDLLAGLRARMGHRRGPHAHRRAGGGGSHACPRPARGALQQRRRHRGHLRRLGEALPMRPRCCRPVAWTARWSAALR